MSAANYVLTPVAGKRALITGGAGGIGLEVAISLALEGCEVILADIDPDAGQRALKHLKSLKPAISPRFYQVDLSKQDDVTRFAEQMLTQTRSLDFLFNNAGIQPLSRRRATNENHELCFAIGHLGHFALTARLLPLLLASPAPRVITTSSLMHAQGLIHQNDLNLVHNYEAQRAYNQTKLANLLFAQQLQRICSQAGANLLSLAAHPGVARTGIGSNRNKQGSLSFKDHFVGAVLKVVMPLLGQDADRGAWPLLYAATTPDPVPSGFYGPGGMGEMKGPPTLAKVGRVAQDPALAKWLWEASEQLCRVEYASVLSPLVNKAESMGAAR